MMTPAERMTLAARTPPAPCAADRVACDKAAGKGDGPLTDAEWIEVCAVLVSGSTDGVPCRIGRAAARTRRAELRRIGAMP